MGSQIATFVFAIVLGAEASPRTPSFFLVAIFPIDRQDNRGDGDRELHRKRLSRFGGRCGPRRRDHSGLAWRQRQRAHHGERAP